VWVLDCIVGAAPVCSDVTLRRGRTSTNGGKARACTAPAGLHPASHASCWARARVGMARSHTHVQAASAALEGVDLSGPET